MLQGAPAVSWAHGSSIQFCCEGGREQHLLRLSPGSLSSRMDGSLRCVQETSSFRLRHLQSLHGFVSRATAELIWLNEKEEEELAYDWSDNNPNIAAKRNYFSVSDWLRWAGSSWLHHAALELHAEVPGMLGTCCVLPESELVAHECSSPRG